MQQIRISGKNLGAFAMPNACPRCLWITLRCHNKFPYMKFPGIFASLDGYSKQVTLLHHEKHASLPKWLAGLGNIGKPIKTPTHHTFNFVDAETNVLLTGDPDAMFQKHDGTLFIGDYKTAKFTASQDELLPIYVTQLNAYALIAERIGMGRVTGLGLIYFEPLTELTTTCLDSQLTDDGFSLRFSAKLLPIELNRKCVPELLDRVREVFEMPTPPQRREGCKECKLLDALITAASTS